jgi:hypothetical protein
LKCQRWQFGGALVVHRWGQQHGLQMHLCTLGWLPLDTTAIWKQIRGLWVRNSHHFLQTNSPAGISNTMCKVYSYCEVAAHKNHNQQTQRQIPRPSTTLLTTQKVNTHPFRVWWIKLR